MEQINYILADSTPYREEPSLSPEFQEWLQTEKSLSRRRLATFQASALILAGVVLLLIKEKFIWFTNIFAIIQLYMK